MSLSVEAVTKALKAAHDAVKAAGIPKELEAVAFGKAFDAVVGADGPAGTGHGSPKSGTAPERDVSGGADVDASTPIGKIAAALKLEPETAADVFEVNDNELALTLRRDQLDAQKGPAMREVAVLVTAGRQAAELDDERTHTDVIRSICEDVGVLDKNAFRDEMGKLGGLVRAKPKGKWGREFKITRHGYNEAASLVKRMTGGT